MRLATMLLTIPFQIPFFGNMIEAGYESARGSSRSSLPPVLKVAEDGFKGAFLLGVGKKPATNMRGALRLAEAPLTLFPGVPGTSQAFDVLERLLIPPKKEKGTRGRREGSRGGSRKLSFR